MKAGSQTMACQASLSIPVMYQGMLAGQAARTVGSDAFGRHFIISAIIIDYLVFIIGNIPCAGKIDRMLRSEVAEVIAGGLMPGITVGAQSGIGTNSRPGIDKPPTPAVIPARGRFAGGILQDIFHL